MSQTINVREWLEAKEVNLSPYAVRSQLSRGRVKLEEPCPLRTDFQRDRDRVIHSKAFRRLKHKTQVFIAPRGDHYRTRLTHTLEVAQIARTISRALNLNEDLTEAIALGHDLGHTPFGHLGEELLNQLSPLGFRHNEQSLRVVDVLEKDGQGLNLTWEVREGILNHSKTKVPILGEGWGKPQTLEGQVVKIADTIAYINHDIDDAIRAGLIAPTDLPSSAIEVLGKTHSTRIATMVQDVVKYSWAARGEGDLGQEKPSIEISLKVQQAANLLNEFLFDRVYNLTLAKEETQKAKEALNLLYQYFIEHPDKLPEENVPDESLERRVVDYIAGMTDNYALHLAEEIGG